MMLEKLSAWRGLLTRNVAAGREVLRHFLTGPLTFTPDRDGTYRVEGEATLAGLLAGCGLTPPTILASPRGTAQGWSPRLAGVAA